MEVPVCHAQRTASLNAVVDVLRFGFAPADGPRTGLVFECAGTAMAVPCTVASKEP